MSLFTRIAAKIAGGSIGNTAEKVIGGIATIKRISSVDKTQQENNIHSETVEMLKACTAEMGKENKNLLDSIIDFVSRLPRPIIAFIVIALFLIILINPAYAKDVAAAFKILPDPLYWILLAVIGFYFGSRALHDKFKNSRPRMTPEQHATLITAVQTTEKKITDSNQNVIDEEIKTREALNDDDGDGLDDRGQRFIENAEGGHVKKMYKCPAGYWTIGPGINLEVQEMPLAVSKLWFSIILKKVKINVLKKYPFVEKLNSARQWVIIDMAYNLGVYNTKTLKNTLQEIEKQLKKKRPNYKKVSKVMRSGRWFKQTKTRAQKLTFQMETGKWS